MKNRPAATQTPPNQSPPLAEYDRLYKEGLEGLLANKANSYFGNSSEIHAALIYETFFQHARSTVRIFCETLKASVFAQPFVVEAARKAIDRGVEIRVAVEKDPEPSPFFDLIKQASPLGRVTWRSFGRNLVDYNYSVMDTQAIRWEKDAESKRDVRAWGNMYNPETAAKLSAHFDSYLIKPDGTPAAG